MIKDDNYVKDKDGKLVFLLRDKDGNSTLQRAKRKVTTPQTSKSKRLKTDHVTVIDIPEPEPEVNVLPVRFWMNEYEEIGLYWSHDYDACCKTSY